MIRRLAFALSVAMLVSSPAWACTFVERALDERFARAEVVFVGRVTAIARAAERVLVATLEVHDVYKGTVPALIRVRTALTDEGCGVAFVAGQRYAIFTTAGDRGLRADAPRVALGDGGLASMFEPIARYEPGASEAARSRTSRAGPIAAALLLISLAVVGHLARRRTNWHPHHAM